jgi:hypothetical protein
MNSIDQYNQMIDSLTERGYYKRKNFAIGGGVNNGRIGFYKAGFVGSNAPGQQYVVKFASRSTSPGYPDKFIGSQYYPSEEAANAAIEERKLLSKEKYKTGVKKSADIARLKKEKEFKKLVDEVFETGDFINFKSKETDSQVRFAEKQGKVRRGTGKVPAQYIRQIKNAVEAGVDSPEFKNILRITGRPQEEILELHKKAPMGKVPFQVRSKATLDFPPKPLLTEEEKLETKRKAKRVRTEKEAVGKKYASEAELERFNLVNNQKKKLNDFFANKPNAINNTEFGREIKKLMNIRIDKDGNFFQKTRPDDYYVDKAKNKQIFDIFDINKIEKGQRITKQTTNLNITPSQFNQSFIEGQVDRYFKPGGRLEGQTDKLKNIDEYLKSIGVKVDIGDVGRIGGGNKVFYESATGKFPHIYDTLKNMKIPDTLLTDINPTINIKGVTTADKIPTPEKTQTRDMYKNAFKGQEGFINSELLKDVGRGAGKVLQYLPTPAATVGLSAGFGVDPKSSLDRAILGTELAAAPALVKQSSKIASNPLLRRFLNLGLSPKMAMRAARIASPLGIASLGGEALYQYGKFAKDEIAKVKAMGDDERRVYNESLMDEGGLFE